MDNWTPDSVDGRQSHDSCDLLFSGGFYSDSLAFVGKGCKKCPNGSYVAYDKKPGKSVSDCKSCPLGQL